VLATTGFPHPLWLLVVPDAFFHLVAGAKITVSDAAIMAAGDRLRLIMIFIE
jgi:hypothetical protein